MKMKDKTKINGTGTMKPKNLKHQKNSIIEQQILHIYKIGILEILNQYLIQMVLVCIKDNEINYK
jgi:hypothetical protein